MKYFNNMFMIFFVFSTFTMSAGVITESAARNSAYKLEDYASFIGLNNNSTIGDVIDKFGFPDKRKQIPCCLFLGYGNKKYIFVESLYIGINRETNRVSRISYERGGKIVLSDGDIEKSFVGKNKKDVIETFGTPRSTNSDNYMYQFNLPNGGRGQITFICYKFHNYVCSSVEIIWF